MSNVVSPWHSAVQSHIIAPSVLIRCTYKADKMLTYGTHPRADWRTATFGMILSFTWRERKNSAECNQVDTKNKIAIWRRSLANCGAFLTLRYRSWVGGLQLQPSLSQEKIKNPSWRSCEKCFKSELRLLKDSPPPLPKKEFTGYKSHQ